MQIKGKGKRKTNGGRIDYATPNLSRRVSNIDEAAAFCAKVNFNRPSNSPSFA